MSEDKTESKKEIVPGLDVDASGQVKGELNKDNISLQVVDKHLLDLSNYSLTI